jgi:glutamate-1-semialdehyde 2,1-aminomutase
MAAGLTTLRLLQKQEVYEDLTRKTERLAEGLKTIAQDLQFPVWVNSVGAMFSAFFTDQPVKDFQSACTSDTELFAAFFRGMLERGVYLAPSQYEAVFLSTAHTDENIDYTLEQAREVLKSLR